MNKKANTSNRENEEICCPKFDPASWDGKLLKWNKKMFIQDKVFTFFYMPVNFGSVITKIMKKMEAAGAKSKSWLSLSDHTSKWNMDIYVEVDRKVPGAENVGLSGDFYSKVYEGNFADTSKWCQDFEHTMKAKGIIVKNG